MGHYCFQLNFETLGCWEKGPLHLVNNMLVIIDLVTAL